MLAEFPLRLVPGLIGRLAFYWRSQHWSAARLERHADEKLRQLIRRAARQVPYYRELFRQIGLDPGSFRGRSDLARIPLLDKETVRRRSVEFLADDIGRLDPAWERTSGSTGTPLRLLLSADCRVNDAAATLRSYAWAGFFPGRKVFTLRWYMRDWLFCYTMAGRSLNADSMKLKRETALQLWVEINRLKPRIFHGQPFPLLLLATFAREAGLAYHCPNSVITFGESMPPSLRRRLSEAYGGARVFDFYGMTENAALITQCRYGSLHVMDDYACHEFVDGRGEPVQDGRGEIVGTGYYNFAMPLIRYRTRDYASLSRDQQRCRCHSPFRVIQGIEGRMEDFVLTTDGRSINLFEEPIEAGTGIVASQYVQDAPDHLYVNILPGPDFVPATLGAVEVKLRQQVGAGMRIEFRVVDQLERRSATSAKIPFLISKIGNSIYRQDEG